MIFKKTFFKRNKFFCICALLLILSLFVYILCRLFVPVADFVSKYPAGVIRLVLAKITSVFPFSLAECLILLILPLMIIVLFFAPDVDEGKYMTRNSYILSGCLFLIMTIYFSAFAPCYFRTPVDEELALDREDVEKQDVYSAVMIISSELEDIQNHILSDHTGKSLMPYSYKELVSKLNNAYDKTAEKYNFFSNFSSYPKPLAISKLMPYTRISGFYTFFSGEANISTAYPDFMLPYTIAHEMAHQRGIAREDEANFTAFLVCTESEDVYIRYSVYTEILNYLMDDLYMADYTLYEKAYDKLPTIYKKEYSAYITFIRNTRVDAVSNVTETINNTMLQSQGQSAGSESYNLVTELVAAYYKKGC